MQASTVKRLRSAMMSGAFLAASWIMASPGTASAQGAPVGEAPPGYMFDMSMMGKSWGEMLKSYGIYLNGGSETNLFGWVAGGRKTGINMQGENTLGADLDMNRIAGIPGAAIHISTDERWGQNPGGFAGMGVLTTANYGPQDQYRLGELSWDQDLFNDHVRILVGRIADNIDFNTSGLNCRFLFDVCGNYSSMWYLTNGNPSYPVATWGGRVTIKPTLETYLRFGAYQETSVQASSGSGITGGRFWQSFDFGHNEGVFIPVEIGYKTNFDQDPFPRGVWAGGWYDSSTYSDPFGNTKRGRSAVYFGAQQMIYRPNMKSQRGLTVFAEAMLGTSDLGPISHEITAGFSWVGPLWNRPADKLNFGAIYEGMNRSFQQAWRQGCVNDLAYFPSLNPTGLGRAAAMRVNNARASACNPFANSEWQIELNYTYALAPGVSLIPVVAYFINPDGGTTFPGLTIPPTTTKFKNAWLVGAQLAIGLNGAFGLPAFVRTN